jgi:hypothetical protein
MKIISFGSCLSKYTADQFVSLCGGEVISCVYHNRSDAFVRNYIENKNQLPDYKWLREQIEIPAEHESVSKSIILNQYPERIGKHLIKAKANFFTVLEKEKADLVIMDNYMDIGAKLLSFIENPELKFFLNSNYIKELKAKLVVSDFIKPEEAAKNYRLIIDFIRLKQPQAKFVFIHFPYAQYDDPKREKRALGFLELFKPEEVKLIAPVKVNKEYLAETPGHFKPEQYAFYAGIIHDYINR